MRAILAFLRGLFFNAGTAIASPFKSLTATQWTSIALTLASAVLAYGDTHQQINGVPPWIAHCWPFVLMVAGIIAKYGHILYPQATVLTPAQQKALEQNAIASIQTAISDHLSTPEGQEQVKAAVAQLSTQPTPAQQPPQQKASP